ncbi:MAG: tRNA (N(6)-L-threonylcarbamoyladenosine(37)-C(2))-methylthiotransferase MtaB [Alphaproteobacteria bacterium]|nr:tRNA (N(6)-L-threonylcarbamoyladenosine(37)-C(2))-methylthiotransferase MtaB [Alphaproteobacteria bacterium]
MSVQIVTFGCRLNTYESSAIQELKGLPDNIIVVNTCAVTAEAERQCRQTIRKLRRENPDAFLVVTGCAAQVRPEVYAQMPEVDRVLGNREKFKAENFAPEQPEILVSDIDTPVDFDLPEPVFFNERCRAFIQIQQGCNNHCTFCIVPQARGKSSYLPAEKILRHAEKLVEQGYKEIGLTGVDITDYPDFAKLVESLTKVAGLKRVRLGSLDPACVHDDLIELFGKSDVLQPHLHLSAQSGDNMILKRMARRHSREDILSLCQKLRSVRPDIVFGADFITGFPTETDEMFDNTLELVKRANITHLHVFPYSVRPGTPAAKMPQVPVPVRKERAKILRSVGENLLFEYMRGRIGQTAEVLYETDGKGLCEHYLPVFVGDGFSAGDFVSVRLTGAENGVFKGSVL